MPKKRLYYVPQHRDFKNGRSDVRWVKVKATGVADAREKVSKLKVGTKQGAVWTYGGFTPAKYKKESKPSGYFQGAKFIKKKGKKSRVGIWNKA